MKTRRNLKVSKTMNNGTLIYQMEADHLKKFHLNTKKCKYSLTQSNDRSEFTDSKDSVS